MFGCTSYLIIVLTLTLHGASLILLRSWLSWKLILQDNLCTSSFFISVFPELLGHMKQILVGPGNDYVAGATHMSRKSVAVPGIGVFGTICCMWFSSFSNIWNFFSESRESSFDLLNLSSYI